MGKGRLRRWDTRGCAVAPRGGCAHLPKNRIRFPYGVFVSNAVRWHGNSPAQDSCQFTPFSLLNIVKSQEGNGVTFTRSITCSIIAFFLGAWAFFSFPFSFFQNLSERNNFISNCFSFSSFLLSSSFSLCI